MTRLAESWAVLQTKYRVAHDAVESYRYDLRANYCSRGERIKLDRLRAKKDKAYVQVFAWLDKHSPWDWETGTSVYWICTELSATDALAETAPILPAESAGYGFNRQSRKAKRRIRQVELSPLDTAR